MSRANSIRTPLHRKPAQRHRQPTGLRSKSPVLIAAAAALTAGLVAAPMVATAEGGSDPWAPQSSLAVQVDSQAPLTGAERSIAMLALGQAGKGMDGPNSANGGDFDGSSGLPSAWCSVFVKWVWGSSGVDTTGIDTYAGSLVTYGQAHGTFHTGDPRVGDAAVFSRTRPASIASGSDDAARAIYDVQHVGIVVSVTRTTVTLVNGDWGDGRGGPQLVRLTTVPLASSSVGGYAPDMLQYVAGYIDPAGGDSTVAPTGDLQALVPPLALSPDLESKYGGVPVPAPAPTN